MRRLAHILSIALITAGLLVVVDVGITLAYREPLSSIYSSIKQSEKASQLKTLEAEFLSPAERKEIRRAIERARKQQDPEALHQDLARLGERLVDQSKPGDALGRIEAPAMNGLNQVFVQGTDESSLELGPGHYPETAMKHGDKITLKIPYGTFIYAVQKTAIVDPSDVGVIHETGYERLVLSACNPLYSASQRFIVFARLVRSEPRTE